METFDIQSYMSGGIRNLVAQAMKSTLQCPSESAFLVRFGAASAKAAARRREFETQGTHIPPFLIASITSACNLHCKGCYSRQNQATNDCAPKNQLTGAEWGRIFTEAQEIGISFILLAGGEPFLRRDVLEAAAAHPEIAFPVFTNGVFVSEAYFQLLDRHRNLIPILSIEGDREMTDARRGEGIYDRQSGNMAAMAEKHMLFGASVTVTKDNLALVTSEAFVRDLAAKGCRVIIYVEYVPVTPESESLAPDDADRARMDAAVMHLRTACPEMMMLCFPGDEKATGGCLAAGRGFFHISSHGDAEPCPFSPYSATNLRERSLLDALQSGLFRRLHDSGVLLQPHTGGCVLFREQEFVRNSL